MFGGQTYEPERDGERLLAQLKRVRNIMSDGRWHTLHELSFETGDPTPSVSARLRDLRKKKFGAHTVNRRYVARGLFEYQLVLNETV